MSLAPRFMALFSGLSRSFGQYVVPPGTKADARGKIEGQAETWSKRPLSVKEWEAHLSGERGLGIVPIRDDDTCLFGAIDIDIYPVDYREIYEACRKHDIPLILCRSKSGGLHGYIFFSGPVPAKLLRERMRIWAELIGHIGCEVFPKQDHMNDLACGNWINMPYMSGERSLRYAYGDDGALTPEEFLDLTESRRTTLSWLEEWKVPERESPPKTSDWWEAPPCLQHLGETGGFVGGRRNVGLFNMAIYTEKRFKDEEGGWKEVGRAYAARHLQPPLRADEVRNVLTSVGRRSYHYTCNKSPLVEVCDRQTCLTRRFGVKPGGVEEAADHSSVDLGRLQKIQSEPVLWRIPANGRFVECNTEELCIQSKFWMKVTEQTNIQGQLMKPEAFKKMIQDKLNECDEIPVPDQLRLHNQIQHYLEEFCSTKARAKAIDEILDGRPWTDQGYIYFMPSDFREFLQMRRVAFTQQKLTAIIHDLGIEEHMGQLKGRMSTFWRVAEPAAQTEPFDVPKLPKEEPF